MLFENAGALPDCRQAAVPVVRRSDSELESFFARGDQGPDSGSGCNGRRARQLPDELDQCVGRRHGSNLHLIITSNIMRASVSGSKQGRASGFLA